MKNVVDSKTLPPKTDPQTIEILELHHVLNGDYLELDDLADPQSHTSGSDSSSCSSMSSDEYFDPIALLQDLEDNNNIGQEGKNSSSRFNVTASIRPFEVDFPPATSGPPLVCATEREQPSVCRLDSSVIKTKFIDERLADDTVKRKAAQGDEGPSCSRGMEASSSNVAPIIGGGKKTATVKMKGPKKFSFSCRSRL